MDNWVLPEIDQGRCDGCGLCVTYCPTRAVELHAARPVIVRPQDCAYCGICEDLCPAQAVALTYTISSGPLASPPGAA